MNDLLRSVIACFPDFMQVTLTEAGVILSVALAHHLCYVYRGQSSLLEEAFRLHDKAMSRVFLDTIDAFSLIQLIVFATNNSLGDVHVQRMDTLRQDECRDRTEGMLSSFESNTDELLHYDFFMLASGDTKESSRSNVLAA